MVGTTQDLLGNYSGVLIMSQNRAALGDKAVEDLGSSRHNLWKNYTVVTTTSSGNSRAVVEGSQEELRCVAGKFFLPPTASGSEAPGHFLVERRADY